MATVDEIIEGLQIMKKYGTVETAAEHDVFYAGPPSGTKMSAEDEKRLEALSWSWEEEFESWAIFT